MIHARPPRGVFGTLGAAPLILAAWFACPWTAWSQPRLDLSQPAPGTLRFRWPGTEAGYSLESTAILTGPADWQRVPGTPLLAEGFYSLAVSADAQTRFFRLKLAPPRYTRVESFEPTHGAKGVELARGTLIRFSGPISSEGWPADPVTDPATPMAVYAESGGIRLPVRIELSSDARSLSLIYQTNLPPVSRVRVVVDGGRLRDEAGVPVDANRNDVPGGFQTAEFVTAGEPDFDLDDDGIPDPEELLLGTDPAVRDTDGDGFSDGLERAVNTDPTDPESRPGIRLPEGPGTIAERLATFEAYGPFTSEAPGATPEGLIPDRLEAVLNLAATPAMVNEAMDALGLRIITLRPGSPFVTLAVPPRPGIPYTSTELEAIAGELVVNSDLTPFIFAQLAFAPRAALAPGGASSPANLRLAPLDVIRMPAAWNLRAAPAPPSPVRIVVPDYYFDGAGHPQLPNQTFVLSTSPSVGKTISFTRDREGNHGYEVVSALTGRFDDEPPTGTLPTADPAPEAYAEVVSVPVGGLSFQDVRVVIADVLIQQHVDLLSTSIGYLATPSIGDGVGRLGRAYGAIHWRFAVHVIGYPFLHLSAAGNDASDPAAYPPYDRLAEFDAEWNLAARRGSVEQLLHGADGVSLQQRGQLEKLVADLPNPAGAPPLSEPLDNVLIIGSAGAGGARSSFSEPGEDLLAPGENLVLACAAALPQSNCDGVTAFGRSGTSFAAPAVAGMAAYLLTLKRDLTMAQLRDLLLDTRAGDLADAYHAVLHLDAGDPQLPMRRRLLDVAGGTEEDASGAMPDGKFDEQDVEAFLLAFQTAETLREPGDPPDHSRFDLNGNGFTGGFGRARFDVDAANGFEKLTYTLRGGPAEVDEAAMTDRELLCYFAHSPLYTGSLSRRGELLGGQCELPPLLSFKYTRGGGEGVALISATRGSLFPIVFHPERRFGAPVWRPDGGEFAYWAPGTDLQARIFAHPVGTPEAEGGSIPRVVTTSPGSDGSPVYLRAPSAAGDQLYFVRSLPGAVGIWMAKAPDRGLPRSLLNFGLGQGIRFPFANLAWQGTVSTDNRWAFGHSDDSDGRVWSLRTIAPDGSQQVLVPGLSGAVFAGFWSPDNEHVAFVHGGKVWLVSSRTFVVRELAGDSSGGYRLSWSPDGRYLAYQSTGQNGFALSAIDLQGGPTLRFPNTLGAGDPAWSPAGDEIAFTRDFDIWVRRLETGAERRLTFSPDVVEEVLEWRPQPPHGR